MSTKTDSKSKSKELEPSKIDTSKKGDARSNKKNQSKKNRKQKGAGISDAYGSDDYKDIGAFDFMKFRSEDARAGRADPPAFPPCTIL